MFNSSRGGFRDASGPKCVSQRAEIAFRRRQSPRLPEGAVFGQGRVEFERVQGFKAAWTNLPDAAWLDGEHFVAGDRGVSECTFKGTQADGSRIEARMVDVFTFKDGKILIKNAFRKNRPPLAAA